MYMTKEKFKEICQHHSSLLVVENDVIDALLFVQELLEAEADAIKAVEPEATASIDRLNAAAYEVFDIHSDIENEGFTEKEGDLPKCVSISASELQLDTDDICDDKATLADIVGDYLSEAYGNCHRGFHLEVAYNELGEPSEFVVTEIQWDVDKEEPLTIVRSIDELKAYLVDKGWWVSECSFGGGHVGWDVGQHSPAGEDFSFSFEHNNDVVLAVQEIQRYACDFDANEHAEMWVQARGNVSGVPDIKTLVEDANAIQEMLDALADGVNWCERKTIKEILSDATVRSEETGMVGQDKCEIVKG